MSGQRPELVIPTGHSKAINSFDFSKQGKYMLTGSQDGTVKLWKTETGQELKSYCGPKGYQVAEAILSPDDQKIIIGANDGAVFIFETFTGQALFTFTREDLGMVTAVAVAPDGSKVWSAHESTVVYWDIETGQELFRSEHHEDQINDLAIAPNGKTGISVGDDQKVVFWDMDQGLAKHSLSDHASKVIWTDFINNGTLAVSAASNNSLIYWDPKTGSAIRSLTIPTEGELAQVAISPDSPYLLTRNKTDDWLETYYPEVKLWSISETRITLKQVFDGGTSDPAIGMFPDQKIILTGSGTTGEAQRWNLENGQLQMQYKSYAQGIHTTYMTDELLIAISHDFFGNIKIFDLNQNQNIKVLHPSEASILSSDISDDGHLLVVLPEFSANAQLFDLTTLQELKPFQSTVGDIATLDMSGDKKYLATSTGKTAYLWDLQTGRQLLKFEGHQEEITQLAISPDQRFLYTTSVINCRLWDLQTGKAILTDIVQSEDGFKFIKHAFSSNGQMLAIGDGKKSVELFDLNTFQSKFTIKTETVGGYTTFYFSKDNSLLYAGEFNGNIQVYKTSNGEKYQIFRGYGSQVNNIAASNNGDYILSSSEDQTLKISALRSNFSNTSGVRSTDVGQVVGLGEKDWAIVTSRGLFDASPGAMDLMYFVVASENDYEVIELEQLKSRYRDPGLVQKLLGNVEEPIRNVDGLRNVALHPEISGEIVNDQLQLQVRERSGKIGRISVFINEKEVAQDISTTAIRNGQLSTINFDLQAHESKLWANPNKKNIVSVEVTNQEGWLKSKRLALHYPKYRQTRGTGADGAAWTGSADPNLYIISVGTADYTDTILDLRYAEQDALAMSKALYSSGKQLFNFTDGVEAFCLTTKKDDTFFANTSIQWAYANKENIEQTFQEVKSKAKAEDVVIVYLSGHGVTYGSNDQVQFYYLTQAFANEQLIEVADTRQKYAISSDELTEWLKDIPALKQVLIIDACNSGNVVKNLLAGSRNLNSSQIRAIDRMQDRTGMYILSGSAANKVSYEASEFGQGLLTYSLLNGMRTGGLRTDQDGKQLIDVIRLFNHARDEVPELAKSIQGIQTPTIGFPKEVSSVDIGIFNDQVDIPVANKKPVVINVNFLNGESAIDDLELNGQIQNAFIKETKKGKDANFLFFPVSEYPAAFRLSGIYQVGNNGQISLTVNIRREGDELIKIPLEASSTKALIKKIVKSLGEQLK